jgi:hypothetical protein
MEKNIKRSIPTILAASIKAIFPTKSTSSAL